MSGRILTFGDICSAIADGQLSADSDGSVYHVNALELRRYFNKLRSLPTIVPPKMSDPTSCSGTSNWSPSSQSPAL